MTMSRVQQRTSKSVIPGFAVLLLCVAFVNPDPNFGRDFYAHGAHDANGGWVSMERYRGKVLLIVNVASECGYTDDHYRDLVRIRTQLVPGGRFEILAFPCNQFGNQEPQESPEILRFVTENYGVNFPVFKKINVITENVSALWKYLEEKTGKVPNWNFWKYLVDSKGEVVDAWGPWVPVEQMRSKIEELVAAAGTTGESERAKTRNRRLDNDL